MRLSHHGFVRLLQRLTRYVCPRSLGSDRVSGDPWIASATGSRQTGRPTTENGRDRSAGATVPRTQVCPKGHRLFVLLLWHTRGFSLVFSGKTVWFDGGWGWGVWGCGGWDGALYPRLPAGMGVGELWGFASFGGFLPTMAWCLLPLRVGPRFASLSFSAPGGKYGPCSALARRSQVPSRRHRDGGKSGF